MLSNKSTTEQQERSIKQKQIEQLRFITQEKIKQDLIQLQNHNEKYLKLNNKNNLNSVKCNRQQLRTKFSKIYNTIYRRFDEEKTQNIYNVQRICDLDGFNASAFARFYNLDLVRKIHRDINDFIYDNIDQDKDDDLLDFSSATILAPIKYYTCAKDSEAVKETKRSALKNAKLERYHCASIKRSKQKIVVKDNKIIISLIAPIDDIDGNINDSIFLLLKLGFHADGQPCFDPNKFSIVPYFYTKVINHSSKAGYPTYEFKIHKPNDITIKDNTKYLINALPDINTVTIEEYIKQAYQIFHKRAHIHILQTALSYY